MGENYNVCWVRDWSNAVGVDRKGPLKKRFSNYKEDPRSKSEDDNDSLEWPLRTMSVSGIAESPTVKFL